MLFVVLLILMAGGLINLPHAYGESKASILVIRAGSRDFEDAMEGLRGELGQEFMLHELLLSEKLSIEDVKKKMTAVSPKVVVLMDNKAISLYKNYQSKYSTGSIPVPSVSIMGVFMGLSLEGMKNGTGIAYEVPVVTSIVSLRAALNIPFKKVGIVHRDILRDFVAVNKAYCAKEGVEIVSFELSSKDDIQDALKDSLKELDKKHKVDAIWVPNDNMILGSGMLQNVWIPFAKKFKKPIIAGVEVLVTPDFNFGTFAVIPDHKALGMQAAEKIYEIMDQGWKVGRSTIDPPTSVYKIINFRQVKSWYGLKEDQLRNVDKIVK